MHDHGQEAFAVCKVFLGNHIKKTFKHQRLCVMWRVRKSKWKISEKRSRGQPRDHGVSLD